MNTFEIRLEAVLAHYRDDRDKLRLVREFNDLQRDIQSQLKRIDACVDEDSLGETNQLTIFGRRIDKIAKQMGVTK